MRLSRDGQVTIRDDGQVAIPRLRDEAQRCAPSSPTSSSRMVSTGQQDLGRMMLMLADAGWMLALDAYRASHVPSSETAHAAPRSSDQERPYQAGRRTGSSRQGSRRG